MRPTHSHRRIDLALAAALGLIALLALPGFAAAKAKDRNHDGIPDRWEKRHHLSLKANQAHRNQDHEGLNNREEFENATNPRDPDTDDDALTDAQEVEIGDDPNDSDTDDDGVEDGEENAGTILSFDGTTLTIKLFDGSMLSGLVTEQTEIECEQGQSQAGAQASSEGGDQSDEDQSGEDNSAGGDESGDGPGCCTPGCCTTADLVPGTPVQEAELEITSGGAVFEEIELAG